jgi:hypothetical protein
MDSTSNLIFIRDKIFACDSLLTINVMIPPKNVTLSPIKVVHDKNFTRLATCPVYPLHCGESIIIQKCFRHCITTYDKTYYIDPKHIHEYALLSGAIRCFLAQDTLHSLRSTG